MRQWNKSPQDHVSVASLARAVFAKWPNFKIVSSHSVVIWISRRQLTYHFKFIFEQIPKHFLHLSYIQLFMLILMAIFIHMISWEICFQGTISILPQAPERIHLYTYTSRRCGEGMILYAHDSYRIRIGYVYDIVYEF